MGFGCQPLRVLEESLDIENLEYPEDNENVKRLRNR